MTLPQRLLVVLDRACAAPRGLEELGDLLQRGGSRWWHLRDDGVPPQEWIRLAADARRRDAGWTAVVNGAPGWARRAQLGVHLKAAQPALADAAAEPRPLPMGRSVHDAGELARALADAPDYLVAGTVYPSSSKPGAPTLGLRGLRRLVAAAGRVPVLAIGGVTPERVAAVLEAGAWGVSVRSAILAAPDPARAVMRFRDAFREAGLPVDPDEADPLGA